MADGPSAGKVTASAAMLAAWPEYGLPVWKSQSPKAPIALAGIAANPPTSRGALAGLSNRTEGEGGASAAVAGTAAPNPATTAKGTRRRPDGPNSSRGPQPEALSVRQHGGHDDEQRESAVSAASQGPKSSRIS
jgi:hypothetical protein